MRHRPFPHPGFCLFCCWGTFLAAVSPLRLPPRVSRMSDQPNQLRRGSLRVTLLPSPRCPSSRTRRGASPSKRPWCVARRTEPRPSSLWPSESPAVTTSMPKQITAVGSCLWPSRQPCRRASSSPGTGFPRRLKREAVGYHLSRYRSAPTAPEAHIPIERADRFRLSPLPGLRRGAVLASRQIGIDRPPFTPTRGDSMRPAIALLVGLVLNGAVSGAELTGLKLSKGNNRGSSDVEGV